VTAGETQLFQTDAVKLTESVRIAEHQVAVAEASVRERRANLERIAADLHKARLDYERYKRLFEQDGAVSKNAFELQQSRYRQLQATQKHGKTLVELAQQQQRQAEGRLAIARKDRDDALVLAPLTGTVTRRLLEPGERANPGTPVLHVADTGVLEASALLPSTYYARITVGRTEVHLYADEIDLGTHTVSYKSPVVTADLRTFEVKCRIEGPPAGVTAGRVAHLQVTLASRQGLGVPADCVLDRGGGQVVFVVDGAAASQVKVETGLEHDGHIELTAGPLDTSSRVITSGQYFVDDGDAVEVQTGEEAR
jgi:RND family efflux transporter MFP subunit